MSKPIDPTSRFVIEPVPIQREIVRINGVDYYVTYEQKPKGATNWEPQALPGSRQDIEARLNTVFNNATKPIKDSFRGLKAKESVNIYFKGHQFNKIDIESRGKIVSTLTKTNAVFKDTALLESFDALVESATSSSTKGKSKHTTASPHKSEVDESDADGSEPATASSTKGKPKHATTSPHKSEVDEPDADGSDIEFEELNEDSSSEGEVESSSTKGKSKHTTESPHKSKVDESDADGSDIEFEKIGKESSHEVELDEEHEGYESISEPVSSSKKSSKLSSASESDEASPIPTKKSAPPTAPKLYDVSKLETQKTTAQSLWPSRKSPSKNESIFEVLGKEAQRIGVREYEHNDDDSTTPGNIFKSALGEKLNDVARTYRFASSPEDIRPDEAFIKDQALNIVRYSKGYKENEKSFPQRIESFKGEPRPKKIAPVLDRALYKLENHPDKLSDTETALLIEFSSFLVGNEDAARLKLPTLPMLSLAPSIVGKPIAVFASRKDSGGQRFDFIGESSTKLDVSKTLVIQWHVDEGTPTILRGLEAEPTVVKKGSSSKTKKSEPKKELIQLYRGVQLEEGADIVDCGGDGNCGPLSLAHALKTGKFPGANMYKSDTAIRRGVVKLLQDSRYEIINDISVLTGYMEIDLRGAIQAKKLRPGRALKKALNKSNVDRTPEQRELLLNTYIKSIQNKGSWVDAGFMELFLHKLTHDTGNTLNIAFVRPINDNYYRIEELRGDGQVRKNNTIVLLYDGYGHFQSVQASGKIDKLITTYQKNESIKFLYAFLNAGEKTIKRDAVKDLNGLKARSLISYEKLCRASYNFLKKPKDKKDDPIKEGEKLLLDPDFLKTAYDNKNFMDRVLK